MIKVKVSIPMTWAKKTWLIKNGINADLIRTVTKPDGRVYYSIEMPESMAVLYHLKWS